MRSLYAYGYFFFYMIFTVFKKRKLDKIKRIKGEKAAQEYLHSQVMIWAEKVLKVCNITMEVSGKENIPEESCCFIGNHQSYFDIPAILFSVDKSMGIIAKKELEKFKLISGWMKELKCVFMDRKDIRASLNAINEGAENMRNGCSMLIFPEGTRSRGPEMNEFKKGSLKMALKAKVPVIPITVDGGYKYLENNKYWIKKGTIKVVIGKPIYPEKMSREELKGLSSLLKDEISKHIQK
ncbi:lysophospholipid acyltransferase family protein [Clostridium sediminicola]|uniref:lysophospholipid acyltransferase family protein n=1 Tax=Clostridium sediminicola TaxID=3114879 RepID=UPI0031F1FA2F